MIFRFGIFEFDDTTQELRESGAKIDLQPKVSQLLLVLLRNRERMLSQEELLGVVWPDAVVEPTSLRRLVKLLREVLGDEAANPQIIETQRGKGVRFIAPVTEVAGMIEQSSSEDPFLGYGEARRLLASSAARCRAGSGGLVFLFGESGVGKSRLLLEFEPELHAAGFAVYTAYCHEGPGAQALWPWAQILRQPMTEPTAEVLIQHFAGVLPEVIQLVPEWRSRIPRDELRAPLLDSTPPDRARFQLFDAIWNFLRAASEAQPVAILMEDFHWADEASLALLRFLAPQLSRSKVLLVVTCREEEVTDLRNFMEISHSADGVLYRLQGLTRDESNVLLRTLLGERADACDLDALQELTRGNPLFLKELAQLPSVDVADGLPPIVQEAMSRRIERLPQASQDVLRVAAVLGREFSLSTIARAMGAEPLEVAQALHGPAQAKVIAEPRSSLDAYSFQHALFREAIISRIPVAKRLAIHYRVAEALEATRADDPEIWPQLAYHFGEAGPRGAERAFEYRMREGERALNLLAWESAASAFQIALRILDESEIRDARHRRCDVLIALGRAHWQCGSLEAARTCFLSCVEIARVLRRWDVFAEAALGFVVEGSTVGKNLSESLRLIEEAYRDLGEVDSEICVRIENQLAILYFASPMHNPIMIAERALARARRVGNLDLLSRVLSTMALVCGTNGAMHEQLKKANEALRIAEVGGDIEQLQRARVQRVMALLTLGEVDAAALDLERLFEDTERRQNHYFRWMALQISATIGILLGKFDAAKRDALAALHLGEPLFHDAAKGAYGIQGFALCYFDARFEMLDAIVSEYCKFLSSTATQAYRACQLLLTGDKAEARRIYESLVANGVETFPEDWGRLTAWIRVADLVVAFRDAEVARSLYAVLLPGADGTLSIWSTLNEGSTHRVLGRLAAVRGETERAREHFESATVANQRMNAKPWLALTQCDYAEFLQSDAPPLARDLDQIRLLLKSARSIAEGLPSALLLQRIEKLERKLRDDPRS